MGLAGWRWFKVGDAANHCIPKGRKSESPRLLPGDRLHRSIANSVFAGLDRAARSAFVRLNWATRPHRWVAELAPFVLFSAWPVKWCAHRAGDRITRTTSSAWALHDHDEMQTDANYPPAASLIEATIWTLLARRRPYATIRPSDVARGARVVTDQAASMTDVASGLSTRRKA